MQIGNPIYCNNKKVGEISLISKESLFVKFDETQEVERFHQFIYNGFLKTKENLAQFDKITSYHLESTNETYIANLQTVQIKQEGVIPKTLW